MYRSSKKFRNEWAVARLRDERSVTFHRGARLYVLPAIDVDLRAIHIR